ncbi:hypothetical protein GW937_02225 [Candidatus Kaiserbacteria bacterium]|nr:hypothetical protein [Candidatus Kaiserbacteria bacterium]
MPQKPQIELLSSIHRKRLFFTLVLIFLISFPVMVFYTAGYRIDLENDEQTIVTTGGIYITTDKSEVEVYLDDVQVERLRLFRSAYYIQNIAAGSHRMVVQRPDLITWVKVLPVDAYMVTEAAAFNMPAIPQVRPITKYVTATGTAIYLGADETTIEIFNTATTTVPIFFTESKRTTSYQSNKEYEFVSSLFASSSTSSRSVFTLISEEERFRFATSTVSAEEGSTSVPSIIERNNVRLVTRLQDIFAVWQGPDRSIPHYYCVTAGDATTTALRYGQHVADAVTVFAQSTTTPLIVVGDRLCRPEIKLNHLRKDVYFYDFFPNSSDLVLLQLVDGLYVTEIDDRAWQNVQQIYAGTDFQVIVENNIIYVKDGLNYFEIITTLNVK